MTSHDDKKHTVSNWFSSLRRQPKPKKVTTKNHLQKSCLDLTTAAINSTSLPASVTNSPKLRGGCSQFDANHHHLLTSKSSNVSNQLPTSATTETTTTPNINAEKLTTHNVNNLPETISVKSTDHTNGDAINVQSGKTVTTITRKITKITVIKNKEQNFRRAGLIFDDNGKLISESIAYQNFAKNFRSNLIGNNCTSIVGNGTIQNSDIINVCDNSQNNNNNDKDKASSSSSLLLSTTSAATATASPMNDERATVQCNAKVDVSNSNDGVGHHEHSENTNCSSLSDRLITSNNLDDEIEFIDSSSSMSDICSISNCAADDFYFNTLPKQPKSYASIKQQTIDPKLGAEISIQKKVDIKLYFSNNTNIHFYTFICIYYLLFTIPHKNL